MAGQRKAMSKKLRFEVFKRDSFTCQYCGKSAPDVVLHVDHIDPVSKGGSNDILNLITSCAECNGGKGAVRLDDNATLQKQRQQLAELSERREQLRMMLEWRAGLKDVDAMAFIAACDHFAGLFDGYSIQSEKAKSEVRKLLRTFGLGPVMDAMEIAKDQYAAEVTHETVNRAFNKLGGICRNRERPDESALFYVRGILRNRMYCHEVYSMDLLREGRAAGLSDDELKHIAKRARNWTDWQEWMRQAIQGAK